MGVDFRFIYLMRHYQLYVAGMKSVGREADISTFTQWRSTINAMDLESRLLATKVAAQ